MEFNKLKNEIKSLGLMEIRADEAGYFEAVITKGEMIKVSEILNKFLGDPAWPTTGNLASEVQETIGGFGGIHLGQTLYFKSEGARVMFAMLWPWSDGRNITIKIVNK